MPRGIPNDPGTARKKGGYHYPATKADVLLRIKEAEERHKERMGALKAHIESLKRREKYLSDLKKWLLNRKLELSDLTWMAKQMRPKRADASVKSKKPLQPPRQKGGVGVGYIMKDGKLIAPKGDPEFRRRIQEARKGKGLRAEEVAKRVGVSDAAITSWEAGRYVPREEQRQKILKVLDLPAGLGAEASKAMEGSFGTRKKNGAAASP